MNNKSRLEFSYEAFVTAFKQGSFSDFASGNGTIVFACYDEETGSTHAHNLFTYFDYKNLFYGEAVTQALAASPPTTQLSMHHNNNTNSNINAMNVAGTMSASGPSNNLGVNSGNFHTLTNPPSSQIAAYQARLLCELCYLNAKFIPLSLEHEYAQFLTHISASERDIQEVYNSLSPLHKQQVIEMFEDAHSRRVSSWVSMLHRLASFECSHLLSEFVKISVSDERYKSRFIEFIGPERLNCPSSDGIPLLYKILWVEKRDKTLMETLLGMGLSINSPISDPPQLSSSMLSSIRSAAATQVPMTTAPLLGMPTPMTSLSSPTAASMNPAAAPNNSIPATPIKHQARQSEVGNFMRRSSQAFDPDAMELLSRASAANPEPPSKNPLAAPPTFPDIVLPDSFQSPGYTLSTSSSAPKGTSTIENLLNAAPGVGNSGLQLPTFHSPSHPIITRRTMAHYLKHVIKNRYPVMQTLLHVLFDIHPMTKFHPSYGFDDLYSSTLTPSSPSFVSSTTPSASSASSSLLSTSLLGVSTNPTNDGHSDDYTRESLPSAGNLIHSSHLVPGAGQNALDSALYKSQIFLDAIPNTAARIQWPRVTKPDSHLLYRLQPSFEMVNYIFTLSIQHHPNLLAIRDETGCTPFMKFILYRNILDRANLNSELLFENLKIAQYLLMKGGHVDDVQTPLGLLYHLLPPGDPSEDYSNPKIHTVPQNNEYTDFDDLPDTSYPGQEDDDNDDDGSFTINVRGNENDDDTFPVHIHRNEKMDAAPPPPDVYLQMATALPQQYILHKQLHLIYIKHILSLGYTNITPLLYVCQTFAPNSIDDILVELLLTWHANPNHVSINDDTPLKTLTKKSVMQHASSIFSLLKYGSCARYDGKYKIASSPLYQCISGKCDPSIIRALIYRGASVNKVLDAEPGPLFFAVNLHTTYAKRSGEQDISVINLLIQAKANVNEIDADNETVLMKAVRTRQCGNLVQLLVISGSNLNFTNSIGKSAQELSLVEYLPYLKKE